MTLFSHLIAFDNMGKLGYSKDFNTVSTGRKDRMLQLLTATFGMVAKLGHLAWPLALVMRLPAFGMRKEFEKLGCDLVDERQAVRRSS
jgi:cytochrome P450 family 628